MKRDRYFRPEQKQENGADITRREFFPRAAAAVIGAGALLNSEPLVRRGGTFASPTAKSRSGEMGYRTLGKTGISVSEIGFGSHLDPDKMDDPEARKAVIRQGLESGINLYDIYDHSYHQFELMSEVLGPVRQDVVISLVSIGDTMAEVEHALTTFNTDYIDLYRYVGGTGRADALQQAKEQGKVRAIGVVDHDHASLVRELGDHPQLDYVMLPYNFQHQRFSPVTLTETATWGQIKADRSALGSSHAPAPKAAARTAAEEDCVYGACSDPELQPLLESTGVGVLGIKPFAGGAAYNLDPSNPVLQELQDAGATLPQAALKFVLNARDIASAIGAMNSVDEVLENCTASGSGGLSQTDAQLLQIYADAAEASKGGFLPGKYKWLETEWKA